MNTLLPRLTLSQWALVVLLAYPWLNPLAFGPSPLVQPWLLAFACVALAWWGFWRIKSDDGLAHASGWGAHGWLALWVCAWAAIVVLRSANVSGDTVLTLAILVFLAAAIGMGAKAAHTAVLRRVIVGTWLLAALVSSVIALCQYLGWAHHFYPLMNVTEGGIAYANLRQRNQLATLINMGLVALVFGCAWWHDRLDAHPNNSDVTGQRTRFGSAVWVALIVLMVGNALTSSRTGALGLGLVVLFAWVWRRQLNRTVRGLMVAAPLIYIAAAVLMPYVSLWVTGTLGGSLFFRLAVEADAGMGLSSCQSRMVLYSNVLDLIQLKPWLGWGWRDLMFAHYVVPFDNRFCDLLDNAHSLPLHLAVELGIPAAMVLLAPPIWFVVKAKPWRAVARIHQVAWAVMALLVSHSLLEYPLWYAPFMLALGLCLGLLWSSRPSDTNTEVVVGWVSSAGSWVRTSLTVLVLGAVLWAAWGYARVSQLFTVPSQRVSWLMPATFQELQSQWLYASHVNYYLLRTTPLTPHNAMQRLYLATALMHYSPEPAVITEQINAAYMAEIDKSVLSMMETRFKLAYPQAYQVFKYGKAQE